MHHVKRVLWALVLVAVATAPTVRGDGPVKPRVRAITGFITIDTKSYRRRFRKRSPSSARCATEIKAAGYDVAGIRISTQPFPEYTRGLSRSRCPGGAARHQRSRGERCASRPNIGPAMVNGHRRHRGDRSPHRGPVGARQPPQREHRRRGRGRHPLERGAAGRAHHQERSASGARTGRETSTSPRSRC